MVEKEGKTMPAFVETIAYNKQQTPWHGLGNAVDPNMTLDQWLVAAGLDWKVSRRYVRMKYRMPDGSISEGDKAIEGFVAIVRDNDDKVFQVSSDRYHPIQNKEILGFFKDYTEAGGMQIETTGALKGGAVVWSLAKIGEDFTLAGGDKVDGYLLLANSHDGSLCFNAMFTSVRVVCWNTLSAALYSNGGKHPAMFRMKHSKKFTPQVAEDAKEKLGLARKQMKALADASYQLAETKVDHNGNLVKEYIIRLTNPDLLADAIQGTENLQAVHAHLAKTTGRNLLDAAISNTQLAAKFNPKKITDEDLGRVGRAVLDSILTSPGNSLSSSKDTWWGVVNGVTHYADHVAGRERDSALTSAWFGQKATMKTEALTLAMQYAEGYKGARV